MSGHTYTQTHTHTYTQDNYNNPRCVHACRGLIRRERRVMSTNKSNIIIMDTYMYYTHIKHSLGCLGSLIIGCSSLQVLLVLLTVHVLVDSLALDAVQLAADGAVEVVHLIRIETESQAVGSLAVVAVIACAHCFLQGLFV